MAWVVGGLIKGITSFTWLDFRTMGVINLTQSTTPLVTAGLEPPTFGIWDGVFMKMLKAENLRYY